MRNKTVVSVDSRASSLVRSPFPCPNCGAPVADARLFCAPLCRDEAKYVRYYRARIDDGTIRRADIQEALKIRLAHILLGGYAAHLRHVPTDLRRAVFERDNERCRNCGVPGTEIDHIRDSSSELANLQLLCSDCHRQKTMLSFQRISPDTHPDEWARAVALEARAEAAEPLRLCDHKDWVQLWRTVAAARRRAVASLVSR